ncbi:MAG: DUF1700 domain-containing protein [Brevinematales bacterium]|nr:DUF1700 domain-containing protein [Brevinematales bacterium]
MKKSEFMSKLEECLKENGITDGEIPDILSIYGEHFNAGKEEGKSEEEIAARLGDPGQIAMEYVEDENSDKTSEQEGLFLRIKKIIGAMRLGGIKKTVQTIPFVLILLLILFLWIALSGIVPFGLFGLFAGISQLITGGVAGFPLLQITINAEWFVIFISLSLITGGSLISIGMYYVVLAYMGFVYNQVQ